MRIYAEDPVRFIPSPGQIAEWSFPAEDHVRVDAGYTSGDTVSSFYDPMLAKLCVWGSHRAEAVEQAKSAIKLSRITGVKTNIPFFDALLEHLDFTSGDYDTGIVDQVLQ